jgi:hypothetical protein
LTFVAAACNSVDHVEVAFVEWVDEPFAFSIPTSVSAGQSFEAVLTTYGDGCASVDSTDVVVDSASASITPFDRERVPAGSETCVSNVMLLAHSVQLVFDASGTKTLVVHGRRRPGGGPTNTPTDVQHEVSVDVQ